MRTWSVADGKASSISQRFTDDLFYRKVRIQFEAEESEKLAGVFSGFTAREEQIEDDVVLLAAQGRAPFDKGRKMHPSGTAEGDVRCPLREVGEKSRRRAHDEGRPGFGQEWKFPGHMSWRSSRRVGYPFQSEESATIFWKSASGDFQLRISFQRTWADSTDLEEIRSLLGRTAAAKRPEEDQGEHQPKAY